jgi:hypothetical protein
LVWVLRHPVGGLKLALQVLDVLEGLGPLLFGELGLLRLDLFLQGVALDALRGKIAVAVVALLQSGQR